MHRGLTRPGETIFLVRFLAVLGWATVASALPSGSFRAGSLWVGQLSEADKLRSLVARIDGAPNHTNAPSAQSRTSVAGRNRALVAVNRMKESNRLPDAWTAVDYDGL